MGIKAWVMALPLAILLAAPAIAQETAQCAPLPPLAATTAESDSAQQQLFCAIDFNGGSVALCPKTWSTSPAALVYDLEGTPWEGRAGAFEKDVCARGGSARDEASRELAFFKNTLNGRKTSGTFAPASLLYYHFSRQRQLWLAGCLCGQQWQIRHPHLSATHGCGCPGTCRLPGPRCFPRGRKSPDPALSHLP